MNYRTFGRLGWQVSEIGHGMWGMGGQWKGSSDEEATLALAESYRLGCNFYDTAWIYGQGHSEQLFKAVLAKEQQAGKVFVATKIPPQNLIWPGSSEQKLTEVYPRAHILAYAEKSLANLGVDKIDLLQLHTWDDSWTDSDDWKQAVAELKAQKVITGFGISVNKFDANNILEALKTDLIDSVQVVYNILTEEAEDKLFPECQRRNIAVIARVPFDEGSLTGQLTRDSVFSEDDWRSKYFTPENLEQTLDRVDEIKKLLPAGMSLAELALRFVLQNETVSTVIPGMRKVAHVQTNLAFSDGQKLTPELVTKLKKFRWDRSAKGAV